MDDGLTFRGRCAIAFVIFIAFWLSVSIANYV